MCNWFPPTYAEAVEICKHLAEERMDTAPSSGCPINAAVEVLGDPRADARAERHHVGNRRYFRELIAGSEEGIATNILASLAELRRWWQRVEELLSVAAAVPGLAAILRWARRRT
jgi:hypothetical protein